MSHYKHNYEFNKQFTHIILSYIPNKRDNLKQISLKIFYIFATLLLVFTVFFFSDHFLKIKKQEDYINSSREIWNSYISEQKTPDSLKNAYKDLKSLNSDFKGWITINGTKINNPIFQAKNNSYYINHNQNGEESNYGALHFDYKDKIAENSTDKNLIIYGNNLDNGAMFGELEKYKNLNFYKTHSIINFSTQYKSSEYKIFAVFVLNANKKDDDNYVYNIYRQQFIDSKDFDSWINEAFERSVINTGIDVNIEDSFLTLVTATDDFENARLVVMAREIRENNETIITSASPKTNPNPRYPKIWYKNK